MATTYYNQIQQLYVAYFNRPADTAGLAYWETVVEGAKGSTAAVSAAFAGSAEYKAAYAGMSNTAIVNAVYMNLFGRPAESAGQTYWANLLTNGQLTIDQVVTAVAAGAQGTDAVAYNDKVQAATAFTNALGTTNEYSGAAANTAAKAFLTGVTDSTSLTAAIDPVTLAATVANVNNAGTTFTLSSGLAALNAAETAHTTFLTTANGATAANPTSDIAIAAALTTATNNVGTLLTSIDTDVANAGTVYENANTSAAIKAALVTEAQAKLAAQLSTDQGHVAADNAAIAKVSGLSAIITTATAAASTVTSDQATDLTAHAAVTGQVAAYNAQHAADTGFTNISVAQNYTVTGLITTDANGNLVLASNVTEANHAGVTALLTALNTEKSADSALAGAQAAQASAQISLDVADLSAAGKAYLTGTLASHLGDSGYTTGTPTAAQILTEQSFLLSNKTTADAAEASNPSAANATAQATADNAYSAFNGYITAFHNANVGVTLQSLQAVDATAHTTVNTDLSAYNTTNSTSLTVANNYSVAGLIDNTNGTLVLHTGVSEGNNPGVTALLNALTAEQSADAAVAGYPSTTTLSATLAADNATVTADQNAITALNKALTALATATTTSAELTAINGEITAATNAFATNNLQTPISTDSSVNLVATAGSDIFVAGTAHNTTITGFGLVGNDALYIGTQYTTLNTDITKGNDAVMEAFLGTDSNGNATVTLEQKAFASSEANPGTDLITITLTGVSAANVHLSNGIITVSH